MLTTKGRRVLLSLHILLNSVWIGGLATILILNLLNGGAENDGELYGINLTLFRIHDIVVMNIGFGVIITGLLFSLFTKWGFFDFYWVIVKWGVIALMFVVITFFLAPAVNTVVARADVEGIPVLENPTYVEYHRDITLYSALVLVLLVAVIAVSVFKPWGPRKRPFKTRRMVVLWSGGILGIFVFAIAILQFMQLQSYRMMPINNINLAAIPDGAYTGKASLGFDYEVEVKVKDHHIVQIDILENYGSVYAKLGEGIARKVLHSQSLHVRAVTGATTTSKALLKAMENSLSGH